MTRRQAILAFLGLVGAQKVRATDIGSPIPADPRTLLQGTVTKLVKTVGYRAPQGHTHTCSAGHVWDHHSNPTHNCLVCGRPQYVQDNPAKNVPYTITTNAPSIVSTTGAEAPVKYSLTPVSSGGCTSGNCSLPTRKGLFR